MTRTEVAEAIREVLASATGIGCPLPPAVVREHEAMLTRLVTTMEAVNARLEKIDKKMETLQATMHKEEGGRQALIWVVGLLSTAGGTVGGWLIGMFATKGG
jgi:hypothetical protein